MSSIRLFFHLLISFPVKLLVKCKIVADDAIKSLADKPAKDIFYIIRYQSNSDLVALQKVCKTQGLPDPLEQVELNGKKYTRTLCLKKTSSIFPWVTLGDTEALEQGLALIKAHQDNPQLDLQLVPVNLCWGRTPHKEKANMGTLLADEDAPNWLRKMFIVLFLGRDTLARISPPVSLRYMCDNHGVDLSTAQKLLRVARFHFHRQTTAATGPRLMARKQMFTALFANPSVKRVIDDEVNSKKLPKEKVKKQALAIMDEIAGDYRESMIRYGETVLKWLWSRLYSGIVVKNTDQLRQLAQDGHEIVYVPCHRSHMDYLLLTYVIYQQGLVTPRIAAGINLNFWPAGPIFRKAGAFFIRRSFGGNRMYSTIFREYLGLLFNRGYPVKFYTEGGRSRTGRLLPPKTGMLAMTIQSMLKGVDRPITLVPVYIGYEHVMEVGTYHKELKGSSKQGESIFGVFKAIKKLRNYGKGYVSFGEPIAMNQFLTQQVPNWREHIDPIEPKKASWVTPTVNVLANDVMTGINKSALLNPVAIVALILLSQENKALPKTELIKQFDFLLNLQREAPYSEHLYVPDESGERQINDVIALNKVNVEDDSFGQIISLTPSRALELTYYRNNILHTYILPALVANILRVQSRIAESELIDQALILGRLFKQEFFLWQTEAEFSLQIQQTLSFFQQQQLCHCTKAGYWSVEETSDARFSLAVLSSAVDETLQRYAIVLSLLQSETQFSRAALEKDTLTMAKRLSTIHNINGPEFVDKKAQAVLIQSLREQNYIIADDQGNLVASEAMPALTGIIFNLIDTEVIQSIKLH